MNFKNLLIFFAKTYLLDLARYLVFTVFEICFLALICLLLSIAIPHGIAIIEGVTFLQWVLIICLYRIVTYKYINQPYNQQDDIPFSPDYVQTNYNDSNEAAKPIPNIFNSEEIDRMNNDEYSVRQ